MKSLYKISKIAFQLMLFFSSIAGLMLVMLTLTVYEAGQNAFAIGEIFSDRVIDLVKALYVTDAGVLDKPEMFYIAKARVWSTYFSLTIAVIMGISMLVSSLQPPRINKTEPTEDEVNEYATKHGVSLQVAMDTLREKYKGYGEEDEETSEMATTTMVIGVISFLISTVGYAVFITKGRTIEEVLSIQIIMQLVFTTILSGFSPFVFAKSALFTRKKYGKEIDEWISGSQNEIMAMIEAQISGMSKEEGKVYVKNKQREFKSNREPKTANLQDFKNRFGKLGS